ncbi:MAG: ABC transporter ATP-binding protein [Oscillospiraceae bacterium]|jgi:putative ABC transport system ATP-binding protein|nr:ABC transporter ATP-binding protein [Oscillospiraceae bacterium]
MIKVQEVYKVYKNNNVECNALNGVSLYINSGEFVSIVGNSGSGKSTLLNLIGALDSVTSGIITVDDIDISSLSNKCQSIYRNEQIGFIFQFFYLEPTYSVYRNVEMPLLISRVPIRKRSDLILTTLELVNVVEKANNRASELSGGEKQRVCIARALVNNPKIILADEPCGNLDTQNSKVVMRQLKAITAMGKTVILVTHNIDDARQTDRTITLQDGIVIKDEIN